MNRNGEMTCYFTLGPAACLWDGLSNGCTNFCTIVLMVKFQRCCTKDQAEDQMHLKKIFTQMALLQLPIYWLHIITFAKKVNKTKQKCINKSTFHKTIILINIHLKRVHKTKSLDLNRMAKEATAITTTTNDKQKTEEK